MSGMAIDDENLDRQSLGPWDMSLPTVSALGSEEYRSVLAQLVLV